MSAYFDYRSLDFAVMWFLMKLLCISNIVNECASDSFATYGAVQMCFDWLIDWTQYCLEINNEVYMNKNLELQK